MESHWVLLAAIIAAVSLAIAPIYWLRPSPRQRQLARLREYALSLGLRPELCSAPAVLRLAGFGDKLMKYQWYRPGQSWPRHGERWLAMSGGSPDRAGSFSWPREVGCRPGPDSLLASLDGAALVQLFAVEAGPEGIGFYWHESGDSTRVDEIFSLLQAWREAYCEHFD